jgi:hypothetical protein
MTPTITSPEPDYSANLRNGNPTSPTPPFQLFAHVRGAVGCAVPERGAVTSRGSLVDLKAADGVYSPMPAVNTMPAVNIYNAQQNKFVQNWLSEYQRAFADAPQDETDAIATVIELVQETYDATQQ